MQRSPRRQRPHPPQTPVRPTSSGRAVAPRLALAMLALALTACGDGGGAAETSRAPERAGELWELDHADDRATAPGALLAYVEGLHVLVLDGDDAFAGMTKLRVRAGTGDDRVLSLAGGTEVRVARVGEGLELRFPGGEVVEMRKVERSVRP